MILPADEYSDVRSVCRYFGEHSVSKVLPKIPKATDSKVLQKHRVHRVTFDPTNLYHRGAFYYFRKTGKWNIFFHNEFPYNDAVATVTAKMMDYLESTETHPIFKK